MGENEIRKRERAEVSCSSTRFLRMQIVTPLNSRLQMYSAYRLTDTLN